LLILGAGALAASAQSPAEPASPPDEPSEEDFSQPMGPPDPLNRGTPRGTMYGFLTACRADDYERATKFMDLRQLSPADRKRAPQIARQLEAVLGQKLRVDFTSLSDSNEGFEDDGLPAWQDRLGDIEARKGLVTLLLQRVPREGDGVRIWKIASDTVARTAALYAEFPSSRFESWLPPVFLRVHLLGLPLYQWLSLAFVAIFSWLLSLLVASSVIRLLGSLFTRRGRALDERIVRMVRGPVRLALTVLVVSVYRRFLALDLSVQDFISLLERLLLLVSSLWLVFRLTDITTLGLRTRVEQRGNLGLLPALVPLQRFSKILIVLFGVLAFLGMLGVNVTAALAGVGVGGVAIAFAAQKSLENLFGGVALFADQPVRVGDFCRYSGQVGTIEEIGLRSTRVRTLDRTVITIPNGEFSNLALENFAKRDRMRLWTMIGVRYETTPEQLRFLLARLREILLAHPRVTEDPARVRFVGLGAYSLDLEVFAYVDTGDWNEFLGIREDIYLRFMDAVKQAGTGFAFPSSTTYLGRDEGLDEEEKGRAEAQVAEWREKGALPFPHFPEESRQEMENTLDWPPGGSAAARRGVGQAEAERSAY
jgi:MscS family membrane protein